MEGRTTLNGQLGATVIRDGVATPVKLRRRVPVYTAIRDLLARIFS